MSPVNEVAGTSSKPLGAGLLAPTGATLEAIDWDYEPAVEMPVEVPATSPRAGRYLAAIRWHDDDGTASIQLPVASDEVAGT